MQQKVETIPGDQEGGGARAPVIGVVYNPRSHRNQGRDLDIATRPNVHIAQPLERADIAPALEEFARIGIDYLIVNGGDGTVRDVLTAGLTVFAERWPDIAILPKGKTNALNVDLGAPAGWTITEAVDAYTTGHRIVRRPLVVTTLEGEGAPLCGFILGAGGFTLGIQAGQDAHRLGAFNSLAVGVTAAWGVLQALFGSDRNVWRRGVEIDLRLGEERRPLPHSGKGFAGRRTIVLASTLQRFPVGLKLFGKLREGLKIVALDRPRRRVMAMLPLILSGWTPRGLAEKGIHHHVADRFEFAIEEDFILDGEAFAQGRYLVESGPALRFVVP